MQRLRAEFVESSRRTERSAAAADQASALLLLRHLDEAAQSAFASRICGIVRQFDLEQPRRADEVGEARAREIATFRRLRESRNSSPRGTSSPLELAIE